MYNPRNSVVLEGRLTRDPEYKSEYNVLSFSIAIDNAGRLNKDYGAGFFDVVVYTRDSDFVPAAVAKNLIKAYNDKTLAKGTLVVVQGELFLDRWDRDGKKGSRVQVVAENVQVRYYKRDDDTATTTTDDASTTAEGSSSTEKKYFAESF